MHLSNITKCEIVIYKIVQRKFIGQIIYNNVIYHNKMYLKVLYMKNSIWKYLVIAALAIIVVVAIIIGSNGGINLVKDNKTTDGQNPIVTITFQDKNVVKLELYPKKAPNTVNSFIALANSGYYDGLIFHRIIDEFMIQGGCPLGTGTGDPGFMIKGEFSQNGFKDNDITHTVGVLSMARSTAMDTAGSQFFITIGDASFLDGQYAAFGKVLDQESLNICLEYGKLKTDSRDKPLDPPTIKSIEIETFGVEYPEPEKIN